MSYSSHLTMQAEETLIRIQHFCFSGVKMDFFSSCTGNVNDFSGTGEKDGRMGVGRCSLLLKKI